MKRKRTRWTKRDLKLLHELYPNTLTSVIADKLGRSERSVYYKANKLGLRKSIEYMREFVAGRFDPEVGAKYRFKPGNEPHNKGLAGYNPGGRNPETRYKPGNMSGMALKQYKPIGTERMTKDGYLERKINDGDNLHQRWRAVHNIEWERHNGPIPAGHIVVFRNGDKLDTRIENLELISRAENMRRNSIHNYPPELRQAIRLNKKLRREISEKQNRGPTESPVRNA